MVFALYLNRSNIRMAALSKRGALIVFEGCDRAGKTTQCKKLIEALRTRGISADFLMFPERSTTIGNVIDSYLKKEVELSSHSIHLTFAANMWEYEPKIRSELSKGVTLVIDRYAYSNVAYSAAKKAMNLKWCTLAGTGLPKPDIVFFLNMDGQSVEKRDGFGEERYETTDFQKAVYENFHKLIDKNWKVLNASQDMNTLHEDILSETINVIHNINSTSIDCLW